MSAKNCTNMLLCGMLILLIDNGVPCSATTGERDDGKAGAITAIPLTIEIKLDDRTRSQVEQALLSERPTPIRLSIRGVIPPTNRDLLGGIKIFLNKSNATAETPADDRHFVTTLSLAPTTSGDKQDFSCDLRPALSVLRRREELDLSKPLKITLAAVPIDERTSLPHGFSMIIGRVAVATSVLALPPK